MDEFNNKRTSIFLLCLVVVFFLIPESYAWTIVGNTAPQSSQIKIWQGTSTSVSHLIRDWTSVGVSCSTSSNNPYECKYLIGTPSDPEFCDYEGDYYFQWRFEGKNYEGTSTVWYYTDSVFMYNINYDADPNDCECKVEPGRYNIGGEISGCCGDDLYEYFKTRVASSTMDNGYSSSASDDACCDSSSDCVDDSTCTSSGSTRDADADGDSDYCSSGTWYDCNTNDQCKTSSGYHCVSNDCTLNCNVNSECPTGFFCNSGGTCQAKLSDGSNCVGVTKEGTPASEDQACNSGYCDNDGVGEPDDGKCFSPENTKYDNQDHKCEESAYSSLNDNSDEFRNECRGTLGFVADDCTFYSDGDANTQTCSCVPDVTSGDLGKEWKIGGEVSGCCGDDSNEFVLEGVGDSTLDYYFQDPDSDGKACCDESTDCVYNNTCYSAGDQGPSVDHDSDPDWCGYPGTWRDCNTDAQCGGGAIFGDYEICNTTTHNCTVDCYNKPCIAGNSTCYDEVSGETLYCMNSTSFASQSSYVENPSGNNDNERYCYQNQYYDPIAGRCREKVGEDLCYNYLDSDPNICGTGNTASIIYCNLIMEYCSFDDGFYKDIIIIPSTSAPRNVVGKGPKSPTTSLGECIETDNGDKPKEWGCVYTMYAENNNDGNEENGQIDDDFQFVNVEMGCDQVSNGKLIEFYCSGGEILAKEYTCEKIITTEDNTSYCFKTPSGSRTVNPPKKDHPINKP